MKKIIALLMIAVMGVIIGCSGMNAGGVKDNRQMEEENRGGGEGGDGGGGCGC